MKLKDLEDILVEEVGRLLYEGWYDNSVTPYFSKADIHRNLGKNPLYVDIGNRASNDCITQPSLRDFNGEKLDAQPIYLSDNKLAMYKIKNFGTDGVDSTLSFFGKNAQGEKGFRREFDMIHGAARRNGKDVIFRTIASERETGKKNDLYSSFWEFSFDGGNTWYIYKPNGTQDMAQSKLVRKQ